MKPLATASWCLAALLLACAPTAALAQAKVDIRGPITKASVTNEAKKATLGSILVEGKREEGTNYDKASITILKTTKIEKLVGKDRVPAKLEDLKAGVRVEATFSGPVAESYPVQARAATVLILPADDKK